MKNITDFNHTAWAKANYNFKFNNTSFENIDPLNIISDGYAGYADEKFDINIESNKCTYINNTVLANENVLNNKYIKFKIN